MFQVPVIAVFTKYEQFRLNMMMMLEDQQRDPALLNTEMEKVFNEHYLVHLKGSPFACLESEHSVDQLAYTTLISVLQECTDPTNGVFPFLKRLPMHSLAVLFPSCSYLCRRIIWSST
jgi:hypothetical protein